MAIQWATATEDEIAQHCLRSNPNLNLLSDPEYGRSVIRISEDAVVKCGMSVTRFEAANQQRAYEILDSKIVKVPRVYRFFTYAGKGYLIMEYVNGQPVSSMMDPDAYLEPTARVLKLFEQTQRVKPGALHEGLVFGRLWIDDDLITPSTVSDIEKYYNERQLRDLTHLNLASYPLVFCHLDIAPRNILVLEDGSLCLIDWDSAGYYPRLFERAALEMNVRKENDFVTKLLGLLDELDGAEKSQVQLLRRAHFLQIKYSYGRVETFIPPPGMVIKKKIPVLQV